MIAWSRDIVLELNFNRFIRNYDFVFLYFDQFCYTTELYFDLNPYLVVFDTNKF
jgi:hypothetical protein